MIIEDLLTELKGGGPEAEQLAEVLGQQIYFANRNTGITDAQHRVQQTWLVGEVPVTLDENGDGRDPIGDAYFDRINLASGLSATVNADEPRQIDITAAGSSGGAGADCMFDYLVSTCFATLSGFTEGEVFTSVSGCTFIGYSTINGATTAAALLGVGAGITIAICHGTYTEDVNITGPSSGTITLLGAGREAVKIIGLTAGSIALRVTGVSFLVMSGMTVQSHNSASAVAVKQDSISTQILSTDCGFIANQVAAVALMPTGGSPGWYLSKCSVTGTGIGAARNTVGQWNMQWSEVLCAAAVGVRFLSAGTFRCELSVFTGAVGIENSGSGQALHVQVLNSKFSGCTTAGIRCSGSASFAQSGFIGNDFENCPISIGFGTTVQNGNTNRIENNTFTSSNPAHIGISDSSLALSHSVILGNTFWQYTAGNESVGLTLANAVTRNIQQIHNVTDSGTPIIDTHANVLTGTYAPIDASYVTMAANAALTSERVLTAGTGITITDGGANSTVTIAATASTAIIKQMYISFGEIPGVPYSA